MSATRGRPEGSACGRRGTGRGRRAGGPRAGARRRRPGPPLRSGVPPGSPRCRTAQPLRGGAVVCGPPRACRGTTGCESAHRAVPRRSPGVPGALWRRCRAARGAPRQRSLFFISSSTSVGARSAGRRGTPGGRRTEKGPPAGRSLLSVVLVVGRGQASGRAPRSARGAKVRPRSQRLRPSAETTSQRPSAVGIRTAPRREPAR